MSNTFFMDDVELVDRSTLEVFSQCPMQARLLRESPRVVGEAANIGEEGHKAISRTIQSYIEQDGLLGPNDVRKMLETELRSARPDVQPEVIDAFRASVWRIATIIGETSASNILKFDGGKDNRSGQIAKDILGLRVTQELDLLLATESKERLEIYDWKSGRKIHTTAGVAKSLQFNQAAVLTFETYPGVNEIDVIVFDTRTGWPLPSVQFFRRKLADYEAFIASTAAVFIEYDRAPIEKVPCWASTEKCRICDVAHLCPLMSRDLLEPSDMLRGLIAANARADALTEQLKAAVVKNGGRPIETPDGDSFGEYGAEKPRKQWKVVRGKAVAE